MTSTSAQKSRTVRFRLSAFPTIVANVGFAWFCFATPVWRASLSLSLAISLSASASENIIVAVATNFLQTAQSLRSEFQQNNAEPIRLVSGSTGKLYAQIIQGAPFHLYLAADQARPLRLEEQGLVVTGSRQTYAIGKLALWAPKQSPAPDDPSIRSLLQSITFRKLAVANPNLAPYGVAAIETLKTIQLFDQLQPRLVFGENIGQTHALVATGNAEMGFVAASSVSRIKNGEKGILLQVRPHLHRPIRQDSAMLRLGEHNAVAQRFNEFLHSPQGRTIIRRAGYEVD